MQFKQLQVEINTINVVTTAHTGNKKKAFTLPKTTMNVTVQLHVAIKVGLHTSWLPGCPGN